MWLLQASQCLFLVVLVFAVLGFMRGWRREIVSVAFILAGVLIIGLNGGVAVAQTIFVRIPLAFQDPNNIQKPPPPNSTEVAVVTALTLIAIILLGYIVGNKVFPKPTTPAERVWGVIPGIIAGLAIYFTISQIPYLAKGPDIGLLVPTPNQNVIGNSLLLIFVVLVVLIIIGLIASNTKKSSGGGKKG